MSQNPNTRTADRYAVKLEVDYRLGETWTAARTRNASLGGLFLDETDLTPGVRLLLRVRLPNQRDAIEVGGVVRWQDGTGVGVQFDGLRAKDVWALGKFFETLS